MKIYLYYFDKKLTINKLKSVLNILKNRNVSKIYINGILCKSFINSIINFFLFLRPNYTSKLILFVLNDTEILSTLLEKIPYFESNKKVFYGDSLVKDNKKLWYEARPIWSPIFFKNHFYFGDVIALRNIDNYYENLSNKDALINFLKQLDEGSYNFCRIDEAISLCNSENIQNYDTSLKLKYEFSESKIDSENGVSIIIPTKFKEIDGSILVEKVIESIFKNTQADIIEIILVVDIIDKLNIDKLNNIKRDNFEISFITTEGPFNYSKSINLGVKKARYNNIILLNDDVILTNPIKICEIFTFINNFRVGAFGIKLLYPDSTIQHAGIEYRDGEPQHFLKGSSFDFLKLSHSITREVSGVTGAFLATKKNLFTKLGGLDENLPLDYNDVDFMIRLQKNDYSVVMDGSIVATHFESTTRGISEISKIGNDLEYLVKKHDVLPQRDPYLYTPHKNRALGV